MDKDRRGAIRKRLGPIGISLVAAAVTAVGFAAVSVAQNNTGSQDKAQGSAQVGPGPQGPPGGMMFQQKLSQADQQKLESFRKCMQENGAPAPPSPDQANPSDGPPKPPSSADRENIQKAYEACKSDLPEAMQNAPGPPPIGGGPGCGPPPGAPKGQDPSQQGQGQRQQGSYSGSGTSSGSTS